MDRLDQSFVDQVEAKRSKREQLSDELKAEVTKYGQPSDYLEHEVYNQYLLMHKMYLGVQGAERLENIAEALSMEMNPKFLDAAASAYLESSIVRSNLPVRERLNLLDRAQVLWERSLGY